MMAPMILVLMRVLQWIGHQMAQAGQGQPICQTTWERRVSRVNTTSHLLQQTSGEGMPLIQQRISVTAELPLMRLYGGMVFMMRQRESGQKSIQAFQSRRIAPMAG